MCTKEAFLSAFVNIVGALIASKSGNIRLWGSESQVLRGEAEAEEGNGGGKRRKAEGGGRRETQEEGGGREEMREEDRDAERRSTNTHKQT